MGMSSMDAEILDKLFIRNLPTSSSYCEGKTVTFQCSSLWTPLPRDQLASFADTGTEGHRGPMDRRGIASLLTPKYEILDRS